MKRITKYDILWGIGAAFVVALWAMFDWPALVYLALISVVILWASGRVG